MSDLIGSDTAQAVEYVSDGDDATMEQFYRNHAKEVAAEVWPGGTVTIGPGGNTHIEISTRMKSTYGRAIYGRRGRESTRWGVTHENYDHLEPNEYGKFCVIRLDSELHHRKGVLGALETVRHELIHAWQHLHPEGDTGHGPTFKQWTDDLDVEY